MPPVESAIDLTIIWERIRSVFIIIPLLSFGVRLIDAATIEFQSITPQLLARCLLSDAYRIGSVYVPEGPLPPQQLKERLNQACFHSGMANACVGLAIRFSSADSSQTEASLIKRAMRLDRKICR